MTSQILRIVVAVGLLCLLPRTAPAFELAEGSLQKTAQAVKKQDHGTRADGPEFSVAFLADFTPTQARHIAVECGFVGRKPLPPGIRKNLARGKPMPPGIAKQQMPARCLERFPSHPDYAWRVAGTDLVLLARSGNLVVEIAADVFR